MAGASRWNSQSRQRLEAELLEAVHRAERKYSAASGPEKEIARARYLRALERFTEVVIYRRPDPGPPEE